MTTRPALQEVLKGVLKGEMKGHQSNWKPYGEEKISVKVNKWAVIKATVIITMVFNYTFCFLCNIRDQYT